jgi:hypothetical protein
MAHLLLPRRRDLSADASEEKEQVRREQIPAQVVNRWLRMNSKNSRSKSNARSPWHYATQVRLTAAGAAPPRLGRRLQLSWRIVSLRWEFSESGVSVVGDLREVLWAARDAGEKAETVAAIEVLMSVLHAVELDVVRDLDATTGVHHLGWASTADFLTAVAGGHKGHRPGHGPVGGGTGRATAGPGRRGTRGRMALGDQDPADRTHRRRPAAGP